MRNDAVRRTPATSAELAGGARAAALAVPEVIDLHTGRFAEVRTYLPGTTIPGVRLVGGAVHVHVVLPFGVNIPETARKVHEAVAAATNSPVLVHVADLAAPETDQHSSSPEEQTP